MHFNAKTHTKVGHGGPLATFLTDSVVTDSVRRALWKNSH